MTRITRPLTVLLVLLLFLIAWLWWNRPVPVDMAAYVPADSMVYLESNSMPALAEALKQTEAGRLLGPYFGIRPSRWQDRWLTTLAKLAGVGPSQTVVAARAQLALMALDVNTIGTGDSLEVKPVAALVIETHTASFRVRPALEKIVGEFADRAYGQPKIERSNVDGSQLIKWIAPDGRHRIVATCDGSVAIIGNDELAVSACLAVRRGQRPSLINQAELHEMRSRLGAPNALAFGYSSSVNAPKIWSTTAQMYLSPLLSEPQFQHLITTAASKTVGAIGWSSRASEGGIEDRYLILLKPDLLASLRPAFGAAISKQQPLELMPTDTYSLTSYNFDDPASTWSSLNVAISSQLDTVSTVVLTRIARNSLLSYGIADPESFLKIARAPIVTVRLDASSERPVVIAGIGDENALRQFAVHEFGIELRSHQKRGDEPIISADGQFAACFLGKYFILGSPADVRRCLEAAANSMSLNASPQRLKVVMANFEGSHAGIVTYTNDTERIRSVLGMLSSRRPPGSRLAVDMEQLISSLPYVATETTIGDFGIERRTRSPLGQLGAIISVLATTPTTTGR